MKTACVYEATVSNHPLGSRRYPGALDVRLFVTEIPDDVTIEGVRESLKRADSPAVAPNWENYTADFEERWPAHARDLWAQGHGKRESWATLSS
jgi:hypothetical protein